MNNREKFLKLCENKFDNIMYGNKPYMYHLLSVESVIKKIYPKYIRLNAICLAGLGHDLFEETDISEEELSMYISGDIIFLIKLLTDKDGKNRKERHLNTYPLIRENEEAVIVKICDRISNIEESLKNENASKLKMYKKEYLTFKFSLYDPRHTLAKKAWDYYDSILS